MGLREIIGRITSPFFVPLRRFVVWGDKKLGTCDMRLTLEPRINNQLDGFADIDTPHHISELEKKLSKDKANIIGLGENKMLCYFCRSKLIWQNDHTFEEYGISCCGKVVHLKCSGCPATFDGFLREWPLDEEE